MNPRLSLFGALLVALASSSLPGAPIPAASRITGVTVYGRGALVTRHAEVTVEAGTQDVLFAGLPASLDPKLLQVSGSGSAQAMILDVTASDAQLEAPANARLKELRAQARAIQDELRGLQDRATVLKAQHDYFERIKQATVTPAAGKDNASPLPTVQVWEQFVTFYTDGVAKVLAAQQALDREKEDTQTRLESVKRQIEELDAPETRAVSNVVVRLNVATAGTLALKVAYMVDQAHWRPTYDVRVTSADKSIRLDYGATVSQSSGEDWNAVVLTLSTAQPNRSGTPPELSTWWLEHYAPVPLAAEMRKVEGARAKAEAEYNARNFAAAERVGADEARLHAMQVAAASVEAGLTSASFAIPYAADIPADNAAHKVAITSAPLAGEINHLAVPKLAELAYLRAAVTNTTEFPLIAGEIALFLDGNFVSRSSVKMVAPGEKFVLNLGVDDAISIKRKLLNRLREDTGLISKRVRTTYDVLITVQNNRKTAETIVVKDQVPISRDERIVVTLLEPASRDITRDEDGTIRWSVPLKPGEKRDLPLKISVEHPADLQVSGLE